MKRVLVLFAVFVALVFLLTILLLGKQGNNTPHPCYDPAFEPLREQAASFSALDYSEFAPITVDNAHMLAEVEQWGRGVITDAAWSSDGRQLAIATSIGTWLYDATAFETEPRLLRDRNQGVLKALFSPDGTLLATGSTDGTVHLWRVDADQTPIMVTVHPKQIRDIAFNPDGSILASASWDGTVHLWDVVSASAITTLQANRFGVESIAFSPDGNILASGGRDGQVHVWDMTSQGKVATLDGGGKVTSDIMFSPSGNLLAFVGETSSETNIQLWNTDLWALQTKIDAFSNSVAAISFNSDGTALASVTWYGGAVQVWDTETGARLAHLGRHTDITPSVSFWSDHEVISASWDGTIRLWDIEHPGASVIVGTHSDRIKGIALSPDGRLVSYAYDGTVSLWDVDQQHEIVALQGFGAPLQGTAFTPEGHLLALGRHSASRLVDAQVDEEDIHQDIFDNTSRGGIIVSPDGTLYAYTAVRPIFRLREAKTGTLTASFRFDDDPNESIQAVTFSPNGNCVAVASSVGKIMLVNINTGEVYDSLKTHSNLVELAFSPDGSLLAYGTNGDNDSGPPVYMGLWDLTTTNEIRKKKHPHEASITALAFDPDNKVVASASVNGGVKLWSVSTGNRLVTLEGHTGSVTSMAFNHDGSYIVTGGKDGTIRLWNTATGENLFSLDAHNATVTDLEIASDSRYVLSTSADGTIRAWRIE